MSYASQCAQHCDSYTQARPVIPESPKLHGDCTCRYARAILAAPPEQPGLGNHADVGNTRRVSVIDPRQRQ